MDYQEQRAKTRPASSLVALSTGPGSGWLCDACRQPIEINQVECRCSDSAAATLRFHQWCYYARSHSTAATMSL